jgi:hypothetical protein
LDTAGSVLAFRAGALATGFPHARGVLRGL